MLRQGQVLLVCPTYRRILVMQAQLDPPATYGPACVQTAWVYIALVPVLRVDFLAIAARGR